MWHVRNSCGMTLPFALILTFIFSALVAVSYMFISVNLQQMQSSLLTAQAIATAEGINERIKARLNTKTKIQPSPEQEEKLKSAEDKEEDALADEEGAGEEASFEDEFDEETESFDEYYADEVLKISRYITFREPPKSSEQKGTQETKEASGTTEETQDDAASRPEANVEKIGDIEIPRGTTLNKGIMIIVFKDEKINLKLKDIIEEGAFRPKLPITFIKSLTPNYCELNTRGHFVVVGENLPKAPPSFSNKEIHIENIKAGPSIEFLIEKDIMAGSTHFFWGSAQAEFYVIPAYDGSPRPIISGIQASDGKEFLEVRAPKNLTLKINGLDLSLNKSLPVVISDAIGISPRVKGAPNGKEVTISLQINRNVEEGIHTLTVATEGGLSNSWLFTVLPSDKSEQESQANTVTCSSSLTLLDLKVVENLLPLIDEEEQEDTDGEPKGGGEIPEKKKLGPFANVDLETSWLLETTSMVGKITKTISEIIHREVPNIQAAITTNGNITFEGGGYQIIGGSSAMATLKDPTYLSNTVLTLALPPENKEGAKPSPEPKALQQGRGADPTKSPQNIPMANFTLGSLITVYKSSERIGELDYGIISKVSPDTIELLPPGLMNFHYEGDDIFQIIPPVIAKEKVEEDAAEKHLVPKEFTISLPNKANFKNIFKSNLEQFSEVADLYTNDQTIPKDEFDLPVGYMGISYIDGTPVYDSGNALTGKGVLIIDTRADNLGRPSGTVELTGDSKNPIDFTGVVYIHGNLRIGGNVNINGALIVDNDERGNIDVTSNALGKITFNDRAIKQTLVSLPFTTKPGTIMISNKPIDLGSAIQAGTQISDKTQAGSSSGGQVQGTGQAAQVGEAALLTDTATTKTEDQTQTQQVGTTKPQPASPDAEKELIDLF